MQYFNGLLVTGRDQTLFSKQLIRYMNLNTNDNKNSILTSGTFSYPVDNEHNFTHGKFSKLSLVTPLSDNTLTLTDDTIFTPSINEIGTNTYLYIDTNGEIKSQKHKLEKITLTKSGEDNLDLDYDVLSKLMKIINE